MQDLIISGISDLISIITGEKIHQIQNFKVPTIIHILKLLD